MSLLDSLSGAELIDVDEENRLVYAWFGGAGVNVYDEHGNEIHYFTIGSGAGRKPTPSMVRAAVKEVRAAEE